VALVEDGVGGHRADDVDALVAGALDGRPQDADLLVAHHPALAGMRVERGERHPWRLDAEVAEQLVDAQDAVADAILLERVDRVAQREVAVRKKIRSLPTTNSVKTASGLAPSRSASSSVWPGNFKPPAARPPC
jgi:hypothetical protein